MKESGMLLFPIFFPIILGTLLLFMKKTTKRKTMVLITAVGLLVTALAVICVLAQGEVSFTLFQLTTLLPIYFKADAVGRLFVSVVTIVWVLAGIYGFRYMEHEDCNKRYFGFYLIVYGILVGLDFSGNLITFYLFYECMTLLSLPLVFHSRTREAVMAGLKYLFYSLCGAYLALFGLYFINRYGNTLTFTPGGVLDPSLVTGHEALLLVVAFLMLLGFGVKAGLFPMQGWLPAGPTLGARLSSIGGSFRHYREVRRSWNYPCHLFYLRRTVPAWNLGAEGVSHTDAGYGFLRIHAGLYGKRPEKKAGVFHGKPGFLYPVRPGAAQSCGNDRGAAARHIPCND